MKTALIIVSSFTSFIRPGSNTTRDPTFDLKNVSENMLILMQKNGENFEPNNSIKSELSELYGVKVPSEDGKDKSYSQIIADSKDDFEKLNEFLKEIEKMQVDDKSKETDFEKNYYDKFLIILKKIYCIPDDQDINIPMEMFTNLGKKNSKEFKEFYNRGRNTQIIVDFFNNPEFKKDIQLYFEEGLSRKYPSNEEYLRKNLREKFEKVIRKDEFDFINKKIKCVDFYNNNLKDKAKGEIRIFYDDEEKQVLAKEDSLKQKYVDAFENYNKNYSKYLELLLKSEFPINNESELESLKALKDFKKKNKTNYIESINSLEEALKRKLNISKFDDGDEKMIEILKIYFDKRRSDEESTTRVFNLDDEMKLFLEYIFEKEFITGYEEVPSSNSNDNKKEKLEEFKEFVFILNTEKENYITREMKKYNDLYVSLQSIYEDDGLKKKLEKSEPEPIDLKDLEVIIANLEEEKAKAKKMKTRNSADKKKFEDFVKMFLNSSDEVSKLIEKIEDVRGITTKDLAKNGLLLKVNSDKTDNDSATTNNKLGSKDDDKIDNNDDNDSSNDKKKINENKDSSSKDKKKDNDDEGKKKDNDDENKDSSSKDKKKDNDDEGKKKDNDKDEGWISKLKNIGLFWTVVIISIIVVVALGTIAIISFRKK